MNDTTMTIVGNLVESPKLRRTKSGHWVANFRVASTPRRFDREKNIWVDCDTLYVTVTCWRALGENVASSLHKGQPVVVSGRFYQREYERDEQLKTAYELEANAVGHDLSRGVSTFERVSRSTISMPVEVDDEGLPADQSHEYLDLDDGLAAGAVVDTTTGEVHELAGVS